MLSSKLSISNQDMRHGISKRFPRVRNFNFDLYFITIFKTEATAVSSIFISVTIGLPQVGGSYSPNISCEAITHSDDHVVY